MNRAEKCSPGPQDTRIPGYQLCLQYTWTLAEGIVPGRGGPGYLRCIFDLKSWRRPGAPEPQTRRSWAPWAAVFAYTCASGHWLPPATRQAHSPVQTCRTPLASKEHPGSRPGTRPFTSPWPTYHHPLFWAGRAGKGGSDTWVAQLCFWFTRGRSRRPATGTRATRCHGQRARQRALTRLTRPRRGYKHCTQLLSVPKRKHIKDATMSRNTAQRRPSPADAGAQFRR